MGDPHPLELRSRLDGQPPAAPAGIPRSDVPEHPRAAQHPGAAQHARFAYQPALDGLRAVAVLAVMAYHGGVAWMGGGLLGVDIFFVLSGYLVTSLMLNEHARTATIRLGSFWARRARRLAPGLAVLLLGVSAYVYWGGASISASRVRGDAIATLLYVANWHYILAAQNYFVRYGAPSPLLHTWSLAVEEQFYLIWPPLCLVVLRKWGLRAVGRVAAGLALASATLCAALFAGGASIDRLYYGTDTRSQALMVGALLAVIFARRVPSGSPARLGGIGAVAAVVLAWCLTTVDGTGPFLYLGGFLVVSVATAAVIAASVGAPHGLISRALSWRPARYVGRISYGLYLYHWPLFLFLTQARTGAGGYALLALRFAATFAVAALSYHLLEAPIRRGVLPWSRPRGLPSALWKVLAPACAVGLIVTAVLVATAPRTPSAHAMDAIAPPPPPSYVAPGGATPADPVRALLIGDSLAVTLGEGLGVDSQAWGVSLSNESALGCDLDPDTTIDVMGTVSKAPQGCPHWRSTWKRLVDDTNPDVVVVLLGRWETVDRYWGGKWTTVGHRAFDAHLRSELSDIVDICSERGAKVAFLTLPYVKQTTVQPDGQPWDMNLPSRTVAYNADVASVVAANPSKAAVINLNALLDPAGRYTSFIDGVRVRSTDDEHISKAGGEWLRPKLLPQIAALGSAHRTARLSGRH